MEVITNWCNDNNGFVTAILSAIGLLLSVIAIVVSIRTARLPFKKKLKLTSSIDISFLQEISTGEIICSTRGISVNAANIGSRNISITYLGLFIKDKKSNYNKQKMVKLRDEITGAGMIAPTEVKTELYKKDDLLNSLSLLNDNARIYLYAMDTEGTQYFKRVGTAQKMIKKLGK